MSETFWIVGEIIVGIAFLGLFSAVITAVMVPLLNKLGKRSGPAEILSDRYARGELTREQYLQMREDLAITASPEDGLHAPREDGRKVGSVTISRPEK